MYTVPITVNVPWSAAAAADDDLHVFSRHIHCVLTLVFAKMSTLNVVIITCTCFPIGSRMIIVRVVAVVVVVVADDPANYSSDDDDCVYILVIF